MKEVMISDASLTPAHINALSACLTAIDGIFDVFFGMDVGTLRCIPVFNFVRVAYATVVLIKLYFAASSPSSELGKVINKDNMKVEQHLDTLLEKFRATAADDKSRPAAKFLVVLVMIRSWFQKQGNSQARPSKDAGLPPPLGCPFEAAATPNAMTTTTTTTSSNHGAEKTPPDMRPSPASTAAAPPSLPPPPPPPPPPPQRQQSYTPTANTGLQLLSEIATNDSRSAPSSRGGPGPPAATMPHGLPPWLTSGLQPHTAQPFIYNPEPHNPETPNTVGGSGASDATPNNTGGGAADAPGAMVPQAPPTPNSAAVSDMAAQSWLGAGGAGGGGGGGLPIDFDYSGLGNGLAQAMDLTLTGLADNPFGMEDGMRYVMNEGWMDFMPGGSFQF